MSQSVLRYHMHPWTCTPAMHIKIAGSIPAHDWLFHLTAAGAERPAKGYILIGGAPADAEDIALAWNPNANDEEIQEWTEVLDALTDAEVLTRQERGWSITKTSDWYRPPSREPHAEAERKKKARASAGSVRHPQASGDSPQESAGVRSASGVSAPNQNQNQNQNQYPYPALPPNPASESGFGAGSGSGRVDEPAETAAEIVQDHLPGILSPQESRVSPN